MERTLEDQIEDDLTLIEVAVEYRGASRLLETSDAVLTRRP